MYRNIINHAFATAAYCSTCARNTRVTRSDIVEKGGVLQFMRSMKASWRRNPWIEADTVSFL